MGSRGVEYDPDFGDIKPPRLFCAHEAYKFGNHRTSILFLLDAEVSTDCLQCYRKLEEWLLAAKFITDDHFADLARARLALLGKEHDSEHVLASRRLLGLGEIIGRQTAGQSETRSPDDAVSNLPGNDFGPPAE